MPGEHRVEIAEATVAGHVHFAGQRLFCRATIIDDLAFGFAL